MTTHRTLADPSCAEGDETGRRFAFADTHRMLNQRISIFTSLPLVSLDRFALKRRLDDIGPTKTDHPRPRRRKAMETCGRGQCLGTELLGTSLLLATVIGSGITGERLVGGNVAITLLGNTPCYRRNPRRPDRDAGTDLAGAKAYLLIRHPGEGRVLLAKLDLLLSSPVSTAAPWTSSSHAGLPSLPSAMCASAIRHGI